MKALPASVSYRSRDFDEVVRQLRTEHTASDAAVLVLSGSHASARAQAANEVARQMGRSLFRIDLQAVTSKYIGDTEKNLGQMFDRAQASGAILYLDEADALFGKRSEVKDSHDRYANIEVAYLLERVETHRGMVIVTTNAPPSSEPKRTRRRQVVVKLG